MIKQTFAEVFDPILSKDAIINDEFTGFREDYLTLDTLLRRYGKGFKRFLEIGSNLGRGTEIIKNALGVDCEVLTLDLPTELAHKSLQHPISEGHGDRVGSLCKLPFTQLRGDSMTFDYSSIYPLDGWYIDGEHSEVNVYHESKAAIASNAELIVWHDTNIEEVYKGIVRAFKGIPTFEGAPQYTLYRVLDTRISYAIRTV